MDTSTTCPSCASVSAALIGSIDTPEGPQLCHDPFHVAQAPLGPRTSGLIPGQVTYQPPNAHVTNSVVHVTPLQGMTQPCPQCGAPTPEYAMCGATEECRRNGESWLRDRQRLTPDNPIKEFGEFPLSITRHMTIEISDEQAKALAELLVKLPEVNRKAAAALARPNDAHNMIHISEDDFRTLIGQHRPLGHITSTHHPHLICSCQFVRSTAYEPTKLAYPGPNSTWLTHFLGLLNLDYYYPSNLAKEAKTGNPIDEDE